MANKQSDVTLEIISNQLAGVVERAAPAVVRIDDGSRLTATGLVWNADGLIVTTSHGLERDEDLSIVDGQDRRTSASLIGRDEETDLALLRAEGANLPPLENAAEAEIKIGALAVAIGRPGTLGLQATLGIVGSKHEMTSGGRIEYLIGTDATIYPGFSGGPLVDASGRLLGINNRAFGRGQSVAVGATLIGAVVDSLLAHGTAKRGYLGVSTQGVALPDNLRASLAIEQRVGLMVMQVAASGPAEKAGVTLGDTILKVNERPLDGVDDLRTTLRALRSGEDVTLQILRGGQVIEVTARLGSAS